MTAARDQILGAVRAALKRGPLGEETRQVLEERIAGSQPNLVPERSRLDHAGQVALFRRMAEAVGTTIDAVPDEAAVPGAIADYLAAHNLPARLRLAPDPAIAGLPWHLRPTLETSSGRSHGDDPVSVTPAFAGIAETGTLMLLSGPDSPTTLNLLPDTHVVVLRRSGILGAYEEALRAVQARGPLPRTVNLITGPSRTGDIELKIQMGAHGPRRLHIVLIED